MSRDDWATWDKFVDEIFRHVEAEQLSSELLFHGTSSYNLGISSQGMRPTKVAHASFNQDRLPPLTGSFWGCIRTAAWYAASDVVERNPFCRPLLIAAARRELEGDYRLAPDRASLDAPVIHRQNKHEIQARWYKDHQSLGIDDALNEIGAVYAIHDENIPPQSLTIISSMQGFRRFLEEKLDTEKTRTPGI
jgi:hypothetical protein